MHGHRVTSFVRDHSKFLEILRRHMPDDLQVIVSDIDQPAEFAGCSVLCCCLLVPR